MPALRGLGLAGREERDQLQQGEGLARRSAARTRPMPSSSRIGLGLLVLELGELGLDPRGDRDGPRALRRGVLGDRVGHLGSSPRRRWRRTGPAWLVSEPKSRAAFGACSGTGTCEPAGPPAARRSPLSSHASSAIATRSPPLACLATRSTLRSACSRSASTSSVSIVSMSASGSTRPSGWTTFSSPCARTTWTIASVSRMFARNLLPSPSPLWAPATRPAMSWKSIVSHTISEAPTVAATCFQALVHDGHDRDVRLDRGERVVGGLRAGFGERVEERGLARVRHAHDPDACAHDVPAPRSRRRPPSRAARPRGCRTGSGRRDTGATARGSPRGRRAHGAGDAQPGVGERPGETRRGVRAGEAEPRGRARQRRQSGQLRPAAATTSLIAVFSTYVPRRWRPPTPGCPARPVERPAGPADREPQRAVLAELGIPGDGALERRGVPAGRGSLRASARRGSSWWTATGCRAGGMRGGRAWRALPGGGPSRSRRGARRCPR